MKFIAMLYLYDVLQRCVKINKKYFKPISFLTVFRGSLGNDGCHITCLMSNGVILLKRTYISPNIAPAPRGLECENNL